jgi:hypothetical protein
VIKLWKPMVMSIVGAGTAVVIATAASAAPARPVLAPHMSAVTLANDVLYAKGRAAPYLTALTRPAAVPTGKGRLIEQAVDRQLAAHPSVAADFAREVQSGNRVEVSAALKTLSGLVYSALTQQYKASQVRGFVSTARSLISNTVPKDSGDGTTPDSATVGVTNVVNVSQAAFAVAAVVAAAAVVVVFAVGVFFTPNSPGDSQVQLAAEEFANTVASHLKAA